MLWVRNLSIHCGHCKSSLASSALKILGRSFKWTLYFIAFISMALFIEQSNYKISSSPKWNYVSNFSINLFENTIRNISRASHTNSIIYDPETVSKSTEKISNKLGRFMTSQAGTNASSFKNPWPLQVQWVMPPPDPCTSGTPFIISIIITGVKNREKRDRIRRTWGNQGLYNVTHIRVVFVLGQTLDNTTKEQLIQEQIQYNDILQYSAIDSYRNLTYKTLAGLRWVDDYCPDAPWVAKIDDDIQVNPFNLQKYLSKRLNEEATQISLPGGIPRLIHGRLMTTLRPWRQGKYVVSREEFPPDHYPPLTLGPAYILRNTAVGPLLTHSLNITMLWLEDVYLTGIVAKAAGIGHISNEKYWAKGSPRQHEYSDTYFRHSWGDETKLREDIWETILKKKNIKHLIKFR
ncbi:unnamed protein product [Meganyctiphanes norvegica]|uniref:Hexosyltransferase n=1 Tax=Meganyctiphanes norvegica TaxID=48144 RepID=A0AAV2PKN3_MEGNR